MYLADYVQQIYDMNKKSCGRKLETNFEVRDRVIYFLKYKFSPEMIVNVVLKGRVSVSTIYYSINKGVFGLKRKDLIYPRKKTEKKVETKVINRKFGKSIELRPSYINESLKYGHFEIDTVIFTKEKGKCLLTLTDRKTRYQIIKIIPEKTSSAVNKALKEMLDKFDIKSITSDNGVEFARLYEVFDYENIYYSHPYCSYERGTNENLNRLTRRFLPKGTKNTTHERVAFIENWIKRMFNYKTSLEMLMSG